MHQGGASCNWTQGSPVARRGGPVYLQGKGFTEAAMIVIAAAVIGAILGWRRATQLKGNRRDRAQYAVAYALGFAILGLFATIFIERMF